MTIRQQGGIFGRNPSFNDVAAETLDVSGAASTGPLSVDGTVSANIDASGVAFSLSRLGVDGLSAYLAGTGASIFSNTRCGLFFSSSDILPASGGGGAVDNAVDLGSSSFKFRDLNLSGNVIVASGKGIDFSATSGTGTSELFDDYEEGDWTPVLYGTTTAGTQTYTWQRGTYTKIGNRVIADFTILIGTKDATTSGQLEISGLPFTVNVNAGIPQAAFAFRSNMALQTNAYYHTAQPTINTAVIALGQAGSTVVNTGDNDFANGSQMIGSVQYYV